MKTRRRNKGLKNINELLLIIYYLHNGFFSDKTAGEDRFQYYYLSNNTFRNLEICRIWHFVNLCVFNLN